MTKCGSLLMKRTITLLFLHQLYINMSNMKQYITKLNKNLGQENNDFTARKIEVICCIFQMKRISRFKLLQVLDLLSIFSNNENDSLLGSNSRESDLQRIRDSNMRMQNLILQGQNSKSALEEQKEMFKGFDKVLNGMRCK
jgi:hypothetical protein